MQADVRTLLFSKASRTRCIRNPYAFDCADRVRAPVQTVLDSFVFGEAGGSCTKQLACWAILPAANQLEKAEEDALSVYGSRSLVLGLAIQYHQHEA